MGRLVSDPRERHARKHAALQNVGGFGIGRGFAIVRRSAVKNQALTPFAFLY